MDDENKHDFDDDEVDDVTNFVIKAYREMNDEMIEPYLVRRRFRKNYVDIRFFAKNIGNVLGFFLGLAFARIIGLNGFLVYFYCALVFSLWAGTAKSFFVDKYPLFQSLRMNLAFTSIPCIIAIILAIINALE